MKIKHPRRKLVLLTVISLVLLSVVILFTTMVYGLLREMRVLDSHTSSFRGIAQERIDRLNAETLKIEDDLRVRGRLAAELYSAYSGKDPENQLPRIRDAIDAISVTLVDADGTVLSSSDPAMASLLPKEAISAALGTDQIYDFSRDQLNPENQEENPEASSFLYPTGVDGKKTFLIEFSKSAYTRRQNEYGTWASVLNRMLSGLDGYAYVRDVKTGDYTGYPKPDLSDAQVEKLANELDELFKAENCMTYTSEDGTEILYKVTPVLGKINLVIIRDYPDLDCSLLMTVPVSSFYTSTLLSTVILILFACVTLLLFIRYAQQATVRLPREENPKLFVRMVHRKMVPALPVLLVVCLCFPAMLMQLESWSSAAYTAIAQRESVETELTYYEQQGKIIQQEYSEQYLLRTRAIAALLSDYPEFRTRENLKKYNDAIHADYLMLFDSRGQELFASNSYTGLSAGGNSGAGSPYRTVLQGKDYVITDAEPDPVSGETRFTVAALITDQEGLPDGFLMTAVYVAKEAAELERVNPVNTVNNYVVQKGEIAALVDGTTHLFSAHSDASMIGQSAEEVLSSSVLGRKYEGFTYYNGKSSYLSASLKDGLNLLVIVGNQFLVKLSPLVLFVCIALALLILLYFYHRASILCAAAAAGKPYNKESKPSLRTFLAGYVAFFTVLSLIAHLAVQQGHWPAFSYVFSGQWTRGIHLFSLWSALFLFSGTLCLVFILRRILSWMDRFLSPRVRSIFRLIDSLITYAAVFIIVGYILTLFGVDTNAMFASLGILSIAVGMGSKDLIADILAGLFMIFEGSIRVGDIVTVGNWHGRVTDMGLRATEITNDSHDVKIIYNSRIPEVINMSRQKTLSTMDFVLPRSLNADSISDIFGRYIAVATEAIPELQNHLQLDGITDISERGYTVRLSYDCDEDQRSSVTSRLHNTLQLLLEQDGLARQGAAPAAAPSGGAPGGGAPRGM